MPEAQPGFIRIRVVQTYNAGNSEITSDLPHLHQVTFRVDAVQPGNPGNSALGSFAVRLFPPGSEGYAANKVIYDKLDRFQRVELYVSHDGASLGKLKYAGIIRDIVRGFGSNNVFELRGEGDLALMNLSRPFPGELIGVAKTSAVSKNFMGTNEIGAADTFNPFTSANYNQVAVPGGAAGTWTGTTDDGFNVVTVSTGTGGTALISKTGAAANNAGHAQFVEVTGRLSPSSDASIAGAVGVGITKANGNVNDSVLGQVYAYKSGSRYFLNSIITTYAGGVAAVNTKTFNVLLNVDDPEGFIPLTISLLCDVTQGGSYAALTVNGKIVSSLTPSAIDFGTSTAYPYLFFNTPLSGTANAYLTNMIQMTRFTTDGPSTASTIAAGTVSTATHSLAGGNDPGPTFLEAVTRLATREGWYWRYTPQAYVVGTRTLGTMDFQADPGTDHSLGASNANCVFSRLDGTLVDLQITNNQDPLIGDTAITGQSSVDGGGIGYFRDIATLQKYGVLQDEAFAFTHSDFNSLRRSAYQILQNKITVGNSGAKVAIVLRDPTTADVWRELDKITIHDPEQGINYFTTRVVGYEFVEGSPTQTLYLDQFTSEGF